MQEISEPAASLQDGENLAASEPEQQLFNVAEVKEACRTDMDFFSAVAAPEDLMLSFPSFYVYLWQLVTSTFFKVKDFSKFALGLPRGHGKTMVVKLMVLYAILFSGRKYVLIIGANLKKAEAILSDVADMLDSYNIQQVFGNWRAQIETDTQNLKKFNFNGRPIILEAAGQGTAIRGSQQKNARPDIMIFDDAQTAECARSIPEADSFRRWFLGTALKAKSPMGCTYIYIGNMYKDVEVLAGSGIYTCMLRNLQKSPTWQSFIVGALLQDGTALWPELHSKEELLTEYAQDVELGQPEIFFSEVLNDPTSTISHYVDTSKFVCKKPTTEEDFHQGNYIVIDPATSKKTPDQVVIGYFELWDGVPCFTDIAADKFTSPQTVYKAIEIALAKNCSLIVVESNAYQYALCEWFEFVLAQLQITSITVRDMNSSGSKTAKILRGFKSFEAGEMTFSDAVHARICHQATAFNPLITDNLDDEIDTAAMGLQVPVRFAEDIVIPGNLLPDLRHLGPTQIEQPSRSAF